MIIIITITIITTIIIIIDNSLVKVTSVKPLIGVNRYGDTLAPKNNHYHCHHHHHHHHHHRSIHLVGIESPKFQLLLKQWAAYICRVVEFACPVIVEDLCKDSRVPVEEVLVEDRVIVGQCLRQTRESGGGNLLEGGFVSLVSDAPDVQDHPIFTVQRHSDDDDDENDDDGCVKGDDRSLAFFLIILEIILHSIKINKQTLHIVWPLFLLSENNSIK